MDNAVVLFNKFPRWVGPTQKMVYDRDQMLRHIYCFSGLRDVFTSVYAFPFRHGIPLIDKLFCDIDDEPEKALKKGQDLFEWTTENHFSTAVNWTGNKGPHVYPLCPNIAFDSKKINGEKQDFKVPLIDSTSIGDVRRLTRIHETRRASVFGLQLPVHCIAIEPDQFLDLNIKDIFEYEKEPCPFPDIKFKKENIKKHFNELDLDSVNVSEWRGQDVLNVFKNKDGSPDTPQGELSELFRVILPRPCIHRFITLPDCPAPVRYAAVCELSRAGMKADTILGLFQKIGWGNFDIDQTSKQIRAITSKDTETIGKGKMSEMGFCLPEDCDMCNNCR